MYERSAARMDMSQVINAVAAAGICACAAVLMKISAEMAGFREWRKHVDATLTSHANDISELKK